MFELRKSCKYRFGYLGMTCECSTCNHGSNYVADTIKIKPTPELHLADITIGCYKIKNVIFHDPATIVFWADGTKTVVKAHGEPFDPEKGLAMAIVKKVLGTGYYPEIKKWAKKYEEKAAEQALHNFENSMRRVPEVIANAAVELYANSIGDGSDSSVNMFDVAREYVVKKYGGES